MVNGPFVSTSQSSSKKMSTVRDFLFTVDPFSEGERKNIDSCRPENVSILP